jgi:hypothetical protein
MPTTNINVANNTKAAQTTIVGKNLCGTRLNPMTVNRVLADSGYDISAGATNDAKLSPALPALSSLKFSVIAGRFRRSSFRLS